MTADLLRRAADEIRESLVGVPGEGYWTMRDGWGPTQEGDMHCRRIAADDETTILDSPADELRATACTFELIVQMASPPVATALAEFLETVAWLREQGADIPMNGAAKLARAILREEES